MKAKEDKFVKLSFQKRHQQSDTEIAHEIRPLTKEELHRIKLKVQTKFNRH